MVEQFLHQEAEYAAYLRQGLAYVCNGFEMGPDWHRVHRSDCIMLNRSPLGIRTSYRKACSRDLNKLIRWLIDQFGAEGTGFTRCAFCVNADRV